MHVDLALGFTPDALPDTTLTIYPVLGSALFNTNFCSLVAGLKRDDIKIYLTDSNQHVDCCIKLALCEKA